MRPEVEQLLTAARQSPRPQIAEAHLNGLPPPVASYLQFAGVVGKRGIRTARLKQSGMFLRERKWMPFTAEQYFATQPPGFVWRAQVQLMPLLKFSVLDMFAGGHGRLEARVLGLLKVMQASGPETDEGELQRYLAETAWFPTALISPSIEWQPIDGSTAHATLRVASVAASAMFHFDEQNRLRRVTARRYMAQPNGFVLGDWCGEFDGYENIAGYHIPMKARVKWRLDTGDLEYFRGEITAIEYDV